MSPLSHKLRIPAPGHSRASLLRGEHPAGGHADQQLYCAMVCCILKVLRDLALLCALWLAIIRAFRHHPIHIVCFIRFHITFSVRRSTLFSIIIKVPSDTQHYSHLELHPSTCFTVWEAVITRHWFRSNC